MRARIVGMAVFLVAANAGAWASAAIAFRLDPILLGTAVIAYALGLRHAVDADHIAAIDNVTRKLMQQDKRPTSVGLFFSLGHSTVVVAMSLAIALAASSVKSLIPGLHAFGGPIGTAISAAFLLAIAALNAVVLWEIVQAIRGASTGAPVPDETIDAFLAKRGLIGRFFQPLMRFVDSSRQMYPIGVLFGLGFDTATEIGVLGIAAIEAGHGMPIWDILIFPLLFTAGMTLIDTANGVLLLGAYEWAFVQPVRKLYYNLNITLMSVVVAAFVGGLEALSVIGSQLSLHGSFWAGVKDLAGNFGALGYVTIAMMLLCWGLSTATYAMRGLDRQVTDSGIQAGR